MLICAVAIFSALVSLGICALSGAFWSLGWLWVLPVSFVGAYLASALVIFLILWISCMFVDLKKVEEKDSPYFRFLMKLLPRAALTILLARIHTRGLEKVPKQGRFMLVCNHINDLDPVTLLAMFPKSQLAFITKWENESRFIVGKVMHKLLCQPINRENDREALKTILNCIKILKEDKASIAVFPEGYTSRDGLFHGFRHGVFKIAQKAKVPIAVCTIQNSNKVFANVARLKRTHIQLHLLQVIQPEEYEGITTVELGERIHKLMAEDLGPELVAEN